MLNRSRERKAAHLFEMLIFYFILTIIQLSKAGRNETRGEGEGRGEGGLWNKREREGKGPPKEEKKCQISAAIGI